MKKGKFYSVGTGPGDPRLLTVLAIDTIKEAGVIAVPDSGAAENAVQKIAAQYLDGKELLYCPMPMTYDRDKLDASHESATEMVRKSLDSGKDVAFLTLGDPSIYSTTMYLHKRLATLGYETEIIPGVPSFCAVAAALNLSLCEGKEPLHILPAAYGKAEEALALPGTKVLMKSGKSICALRDSIHSKNAYAVERCGMEGQRIHRDLSTIREDSSYFSVLIVKEEEE